MALVERAPERLLNGVFRRGARAGSVQGESQQLEPKTRPVLPRERRDELFQGRVARRHGAPSMGEGKSASTKIENERAGQAERACPAPSSCCGSLRFTSTSGFRPRAPEARGPPPTAGTPPAGGDGRGRPFHGLLLVFTHRVARDTCRVHLGGGPGFRRAGRRRDLSRRISEVRERAARVLRVPELRQDLRLQCAQHGDELLVRIALDLHFGEPIGARFVGDVDEVNVVVKHLRKLGRRERFAGEWHGPRGVVFADACGDEAQAVLAERLVSVGGGHGGGVSFRVDVLGWFVP